MIWASPWMTPFVLKQVILLALPKPNLGHCRRVCFLRDYRNHHYPNRHRYLSRYRNRHRFRRYRNCHYQNRRTSSRRSSPWALPTRPPALTSSYSPSPKRRTNGRRWSINSTLKRPTRGSRPNNARLRELRLRSWPARRTAA